MLVMQMAEKLQILPAGTQIENESRKKVCRPAAKITVGRPCINAVAVEKILVLWYIPLFVLFFHLHHNHYQLITIVLIFHIGFPFRIKLRLWGEKKDEQKVSKYEKLAIGWKRRESAVISSSNSPTRWTPAGNSELISPRREDSLSADLWRVKLGLTRKYSS